MSNDENINYCDAFMAIKLRTAAGVLMARLRKLKAIDDEMVDYFKDRAQIEEAHAKLLNRLAKKLTAAEKERGKDKQLLGKLASAWDLVQSNSGESGKCHTLLAERLINDLETTIVKSKETRESAQWTGLKGYESMLNKLAKEHEEHISKVEKFSKQLESANESGPAGSKTVTKTEKRLQEAQEKQEKFKEHCQRESKNMFQMFETMDRTQMEFIKGILKKSVEFQINNLKLQLMNLEQSLASIDQIDLDKELADFARQYAKEKSLETEKERDDGDSTTNSDQKSISSQTRKTAAGETPVSATDSTLNDFKVDEEGYRVPQMDHSKWLNEFTTATQPDTSAEEGEVVGSISAAAPPKIKFDIKTPAANTNSAEMDDIEKAAAQIKSLLSLTPNQGYATIRRRQRGTQQQQALNGGGALNTVGDIPASDASSINSQLSAIATPLSARPSPLGARLEQKSTFSITETPVTTSPSPAIIPALIVSPPVQQKPTEAIENLGVRFKLQEYLTANIAADGSIKRLIIQGSVLVTILAGKTLESTSTLPVLCISPPFSSEFDYYDPSINLATSDPPPIASTGPFKCDLAALHADSRQQSSIQRQSQVALFNYRFITSDQESAKRCLPILISAKMRATPVLSQLAVSFNYNRESNYNSTPADDVSILLGVEDITDPPVPITKPQAMLNVEKKKLLWKLGNIGTDPVSLHKLLAQWQVKSRESGAVVSAAIALKFHSTGPVVSGLKMEIAQTGQANIPVRQEWIESITMGQLMIEAAVVMTE